MEKEHRCAAMEADVKRHYDVFQDVADAIEQMALYIKERDRHVTELEDEIVRLRPLAEANARVAAQTPGLSITRTEALAISHTTLENAEAERTASDDAAVSLEEENARLKAELADSKETIDLFMHCMQRANRLWRVAHPDEPPCIPDGADAIVWLKEQVDALAERRCKTCQYCDQWTTSLGEPRAACARLYDAHRGIVIIVPERDFCSRWQAKGAADE